MVHINRSFGRANLAWACQRSSRSLTVPMKGYVSCNAVREIHSVVPSTTTAISRWVLEVSAKAVNGFTNKNKKTSPRYFFFFSRVENGAGLATWRELDATLVTAQRERILVQGCRAYARLRVQSFSPEKRCCAKLPARNTPVFVVSPVYSAWRAQWQRWIRYKSRYGIQVVCTRVNRGEHFERKPVPPALTYTRMTCMLAISWSERGLVRIGFTKRRLRKYPNIPRIPFPTDVARQSRQLIRLSFVATTWCCIVNVAR